MQKFLDLESSHIGKYEGNSKRFKKFKNLKDKKPYRDLSRNVQMHKIPNWTKYLREDLIPVLQKAEKFLVEAVKLLKK